ncbi:AcvB/VirJ family lysyl-phosphatidylglycerol hydrolase [Tahibacter soli]|uniref:Cutinase family protein n=1 Tax=Tahibacter soli TaxID=2983605 RepID=A0A9X4BKV9_9GAMM|nr:AcvB/VirJ family lysyl-phosphatidylglycerol hydrolase [Tahibacter soli]MDC8013619.1 cutinase family protein [Tahibacter soli]
MTLSLAFALIAATTATASTEPLHYGLFGDLHVARPEQAAQRTLLFLSDADGWNAREESYADALAGAGALVVGIDLPSYLKELYSIKAKCAYPAAHVEEVSHWVERHENFADYTAPTLVGLDAGATFAYAVAAQAPAGTFASLVTLGYDFEFRLQQPLCPGDAGTASADAGHRHYRVVPVPHLPTPWLPQPFAPGTRVNGLPQKLMQVAPFLAHRHVERAPPAALVASLERWQRREARRAKPLPEDVADLPLTDIAPEGPFKQRVAIILTGDGGWAGLDQGVAAALAKDGVRVIGLSTLKFFWQTRKPEEAAEAVSRIIGHYAAEFPDARFALIGYSFGASLAPVVVNRLPDEARAKLDAQFMISPDDEAVFEIKVGDWFGNVKHDGALPIAPELAKSAVPAFCVHGADEDDSICRTLDTKSATPLQLPGGHHYDGDYEGLGKLVATHWPVKG